MTTSRETFEGREHRRKNKNKTPIEKETAAMKVTPLVALTIATLTADALAKQTRVSERFAVPEFTSLMRDANLPTLFMREARICYFVTIEGKVMCATKADGQWAWKVEEVSPTTRIAKAAGAYIAAHP